MRSAHLPRGSRWPSGWSMWWPLKALVWIPAGYLAVFFFSLSILSIVISISCHYLSSRICYSQTRDNELVLSASSTSPHPPVYQTERPYERSWTANRSVGTWRMSTQNWGEWLCDTMVTTARIPIFNQPLSIVNSNVIVKAGNRIPCSSLIPGPSSCVGLGNISYYWSSTSNIISHDFRMAIHYM